MTVVNFQPTTFTNTTFQATLDGALYTCTVTWNLYRAGTDNSGWYLNVYSQANVRIVSVPLVSSSPSPASGINLVAGWFKTSAIYYYEGTQTIVVTP